MSFEIIVNCMYLIGLSILGHSGCLSRALRLYVDVCLR